MSLRFARINLDKTNYAIADNWQWLDNPDPVELDAIYVAYCRYKRFKSVKPIFPEEYTRSGNRVIGYYDKGQLVAFTLLREYNQHHVESDQFAWNYHNPELELGYASIKNECAVYKQLGYKYLYLGYADHYKSLFDGYEVLGPV